jgi:hypothetical protein
METQTPPRTRSRRSLYVEVKHFPDLNEGRRGTAPSLKKPKKRPEKKAGKKVRKGKRGNEERKERKEEEEGKTEIT